jgi:hypothetical protein
MDAKGSLSFGFWVEARKKRERDQLRIGQKRYPKRVLAMLLNGLVLLLLLALILFARMSGQRSGSSLAPFTPIGDVAVVTAPGFDTCVAPPASLLQTWWNTSPYRWLNVYLGGVSMFPTCGGKNLTSDWVRSVYGQGWSMLPTWVGLQAPCAVQHSVMSDNASTSYAQGRAEADAAMLAAHRLDFSNTAPIYFDMEYFKASLPNGSHDTACIQAVNAFLHGWESELTTRGHFAGVYASASNYPVLDSSLMGTSAVAWIAGGGSWAEKYNGACSVYGNKYISNNAWADHQRVYQYTGGHDETYGQATWNIDSDCADAPMVGHVTTAPVVLQFQHSS